LDPRPGRQFVAIVHRRTHLTFRRPVRSASAFRILPRLLGELTGLRRCERTSDAKRRDSPTAGRQAARLGIASRFDYRRPPDELERAGSVGDGFGTWKAKFSGPQPMAVVALSFSPRKASLLAAATLTIFSPVVYQQLSAALGKPDSKHPAPADAVEDAQTPRTVAAVRPDPFRASE
jgi:hypothetical protein